MYIIFDTETTGLPKDFNAPITNTDNWPRLVQLAWQIHNKKGELVEVKNYIVKPEGFSIPYNAEKIHGISTERAHKQGMPLDFVLKEFEKDLIKSEYSIGHNVVFDNNIMGCEYYRKGIDSTVMDIKNIDTKNVSVDYCAIPGGRGGKFKWPTLSELHQKLFSEGFNEAHNASADVEATARCFLELLRIGVIRPETANMTKEEFEVFTQINPEPFQLIGLNIQPYAPTDLEVDTESEDTSSSSKLIDVDLDKNKELLDNAEFTHLHVHSQYSVLQSTTTVNDLLDYASKNNQRAIAITDRGNLMAAFSFVKTILGHNKNLKKEKAEAEEKGEVFHKKDIVPILGSEFNVCKDHTNKKVKDNGFQVLLYAKNREGFTNLSKLSSASHVHGFYYIPRIDKNLILEHKENLMVLTGGLHGFLASMILNEGIERAEEELLWWKTHFGNDLYVELVRHGLDEEHIANKEIIALAKKHDLKLIAANDTFYTHQKQSNAHDILLCIKDAEKQKTPKGRGRGYRYGLETEEYYLKSPEQMKALFIDIPESILNISEFIDKCEPYPLARDVLLPAFDIPQEFIHKEDELDGGKRGENAFLRHLTYEGANRRYDEITEEIRERLDFELATIEKTGYPGYFLIVQDFTTEARNMGVSVGPGRGSAAGSAVAYCIGITNVDPIEYDLLFERFLNPDRVSMPDIDIDFDDEGRDKIIQWVIDKYGASQVAQIITYGTMAAKSSIKDTARVLDLPIDEANRLTKLVPDNAKLKKFFKMDDDALQEKYNPDEVQNIETLKAYKSGHSEVGKVLQQAEIIEGSLRNTGIHACGVIITPDDITKFVPVTTGKDSGMYLTQYDNAVVESAGLLKMDFLGLKTLTVINEAIRLVKKRHGISIDPDEIPLNDQKTYELYQRGETNGTFQFESPGMQQHLRALKPDKFEDLIAMNALYRPGPMEYIPEFVKRKHGLSEITYDLDGMEDYLEETYGITVYQEQVMLLSQKLAGFSKGDADTLRKAMGKKIYALLEQMRPKFLKGGEERGHDKATLMKVWNDWEAFAAYAFNKSHATCYSFVAYHTGYLKANYPPEFMASVLTNNSNDIKKVTFLMSECQRMGVQVLSPDVNESENNFTVNQDGEVRFGLSAIKGVGGGAVKSLIEERTQNGPFVDIFDFVKRVDLRAVNKRTFENLVLAGAFDSFDEVHRGLFFFEINNKGETFLNQISKFGTSYKAHLDAPADLFGDAEEFSIPNPTIPNVPEMDKMEALKLEKEVVGVYISSHPLDSYKQEIKYISNATLADLDDGRPNDFGNNNNNSEGDPEAEAERKAAELAAKEKAQQLKNKEFRIIGQVVEIQEKVTRKGKPFGIFTIEDYSGQKEFFVFSEQYSAIKTYLITGAYIMLKIKYVPGRFNKDELQLQFQSACFLADVFEKFFRKVELKIDLKSIDDKLVDHLIQITEDNPGSKSLTMKILDHEHKKSMQFASRNAKIDITREFLSQLEALGNVTVKIS
ncbi:MAG: DNA polymerase III subunit alpha [Flavobacteriales bacterium]